MTVEFNNLRVVSRPIEGSPSNFDADSFPTLDVIEDSPAVSDIGEGELSVDNDVSVGSVSHKFDVVDDQAETVRDSGSLDLEFVFSGFDVDDKVDGVDVVVSGDN
mgnify:CR=1 FL=1